MVRFDNNIRLMNLEIINTNEFEVGLIENVVTYRHVYNQTMKLNKLKLCLPDNINNTLNICFINQNVCEH